MPERKTYFPRSVIIPPARVMRGGKMTAHIQLPIWNQPKKRLVLSKNCTSSLSKDKRSLPLQKVDTRTNSTSKHWNSLLFHTNC